MARGGARKGAGRPKGSTTFWTPEQLDRFRGRIQTDKIIQRLNALVVDNEEMSASAVTAAIGLLRKVLPDLAAMEHSGEVARPNVVRVPEVSASPETWQDQHKPKPPTIQ